MSHLPAVPRLSMLLALGLFASVAGPAVASPAADGDKPSRQTRQLLRENGLKRFARQEPAQAIRSLDDLRSEGEASAGQVATAIAEIALKAGRETPPGQDLGYFLCAAAESYSEALDQAARGVPDSGPAGGPPSALDLYRTAVEGLVEALRQNDSAALYGEAQQVPGPLRRYVLSWVDVGEDWTPATHEFVAASAVPRTRKVTTARASGLGAPVVAIRKEDRSETLEPKDGVLPFFRYFYALTAVLEFGEAGEEQPLPATLRLVDPRTNEAHLIGARSYPLSIDLGAQLAVSDRNTDAIFAKKGVRYAGKYMSLTSLYIVEPFRSGKIPVVLIHGLASSPLTWAKPYEAFMLDAEIRRRYQFWLFAYPTGLPFPYSAMLLRRSLRTAMERLEAVGRDPANDGMLMVGHSMGGLLTRMQVTDAGTALWDAAIAVPPEELGLPPEDLQLLIESLVVEPLPSVERVVFCSTPHRGSKYAAKGVGKVGSAMVKLPPEIAGLSKRAVLSGASTDGSSQPKKVPDSVKTLRPKDPIVLALDTLEIDGGVTYHSIIGDRGKGNTPDSSDGVVPYWSSHLEGAASEAIVPSGHSSHRHPDGIKELTRILRLHLEDMAARE